MFELDIDIKSYCARELQKKENENGAH